MKKIIGYALMTSPITAAGILSAYFNGAWVTLGIGVAAIACLGLVWLGDKMVNEY